MAMQEPDRRFKFGRMPGNSQPSSNDSLEGMTMQVGPPQRAWPAISMGLQRSASSVTGSRPVVQRRLMVQEEYESDYYASDAGEGNSLTGNFERSKVERRDIAVHNGVGHTYFLPPNAVRATFGRLGGFGQQGTSLSSGKSSPHDSSYSSQIDPTEERAGSREPIIDEPVWLESEELNGARLLTPDANSLGKGFDFPVALPGPRSGLTDYIVDLRKIHENLSRLTQPLKVILDTRMMDIVVSHYDTYNSIWMWICNPGSTAAFKELMVDYSHCLEKIYNSLPRLMALEEYQKVIVYSLEKNAYCRGHIYRLSTEKNSARVHLIDYGDIKAISGNMICAMPKDVSQFAHLAHRCRMREIDYGFEPHNAEDFKSSFNTIINNGELRGRVVGGSVKMLEVELEFGTYHNSVNQYLQQLGFQRPLVVLPPRPRKWVVEHVPSSVRLMSVESASVFFCWPGPEQEVRSKISGLSAAMALVYENSPEPLTIPESGVLVAVLHNGLWYRGRVLDVNLDYTCLVDFVDFGRTGVTTFASVRPLIAEFTYPEQYLGALALRCREVGALSVELDTLPNTLKAANAVLKDSIGKQIEITPERFHPAEGDEGMTRGSDYDVLDFTLHLASGKKYSDAVKEATCVDHMPA